uniref:Uncharacterized protein n=1 Tax=Caenorhabditis tropicalis TaxID=1561998 RepID=A0A1I7U6P7_9PELO
MAAQNLGKECDTIKYERDSWKSLADKHKKDVMKLTQSLKDKEKELLQKTTEIVKTPRRATPQSMSSTPNYTDTITPPEEGEIVGTPPQRSPHISNGTITKTEKSLQKVVIQKIVEKKVPPPIASGFESWVPKEKLNAPPPEIPKAVSAFGVPIKASEAEKSKFGPCSQPAPWERAAKATTAAASDSLSEAISKIQSEAFMGGVSTPSYSSKSYREEINRVMTTRKRVGDELSEEQQIEEDSTSATYPAKKIKSVDPLPTTPASSKPVKSVANPAKISSPCIGVGSLSNLKKIPKLSDKPPQAEFAPALGMSGKTNDDLSIPGLGLDRLDDKTKENKWKT